MQKICYPAIFHPEDIGYSVFVPDFDKVGYGCYTQGDTLEEAMSMVFDAIGLCIEDLIENHRELPAPSKPESIDKENSDFVVPVVFDLDKYKQQEKSKAVKKTLTIPEWLNDLAIEKGVNFSQTLQTALANQLGVTL